MANIISPNDLPASVRTHELVDAMVDGANAKASRVAPCLGWADEDETHPSPSVEQIAEARLVLIGAVKRWAEAGAGALQQESAGIFAHTIDTRQRTGFNLWPSEIEALQDICSSDAEAKAFTIDTAPALCGIHLPWCALNFGATYCSCGVDIAGYPIYEQA